MDIQEMKQRGLLLMECVAGSHMYGTNIATSDTDIRGLYRFDPRDWVTLFAKQPEISENNQDTKYYELRRFMELAMTANPNILDFLWCPADCLRATSNIYRKLVENRDLFITSKCYFSHSGYSFAQIKKAQGKNKKVNRTSDYMDENGVSLLRNWLTKGLITPEWVESRFCAPFKDYLMRDREQVPTENTDWKAMDALLEANAGNFDTDNYGNIKLRGPARKDFVRLINPPGWATLGYETEMPMRPFPLGKSTVDLKQCHVAALEHVPYTFRLYFYGEGAKGVFHDGQIVCQNIPIEDEHIRFIGLMVFNHPEYDQARKDYKSYFEWRGNRNNSRWEQQEAGETNYDVKNMCHCIRLLMSGEHILRHGEPMVRVMGDTQRFLLDIRAGKFTYEYLLKMAEKKTAELETLYKATLLPHSPNTKRIAELYEELAFMELVQ